MNSKGSKGKRWLLTIVFLFCLVFFGGTSWYGVESVFENTKDAEFCASCHTMEPMRRSYEQDVHGGNNKMGVVVDCLGCHLPHDGPFHYAVAKAQTGLHDIWAELTYDLEKIDWIAKRERREHYVYDSGCLSCHQNLERATMASNRAFVAHKPYFLGTTEKKCVSCHQFVGHHNLKDFISNQSQ